jgi:hypothetical protein
VKLRVKITPDRSVWKWEIQAWYTDEQARGRVGYGDNREEGWYYVVWAIPHSLAEFGHFEGTCRSEEKARSSARRALHDAAGRIAVQAFDEGLGRQNGYTVEV